MILLVLLANVLLASLVLLILFILLVLLVLCWYYYVAIYQRYNIDIAADFWTYVISIMALVFYLLLAL